MMKASKRRGAMVAAFGLGLAGVGLVGVGDASALTATGHSSGHYDVVAEVECDGSLIEEIELFVENHATEDEMPEEDWYIFGGQTEPTLGFAVEYDDASCGSNQPDVEFGLTDAVGDVPGWVNAYNDDPPWSSGSPFEFEADESGPTIPGPYILGGSTADHVDTEWTFSGANFFGLEFTVTPSGSSTPVDSTPLWVEQV